MITISPPGARGPKDADAEDQRGISHRRRADDREVDVAAAFENCAGCGGFELIFGHVRFAARRECPHRGFTEFSRLANTLQLFAALFVDQLVYEARLEAKIGIGQRFSERIVWLTGR